MKALLLNALHEPLTYTDAPDPVATDGYGVVNIRAAAFNHRDLFITQGLYAGIQLPCILGSDGVGEYEGRRVIVYPARAWGDNPATQGKNFRVLGMPDPGTFAEKIAVPIEDIFDLPEHLTWEQGACLPIAGLTAWRTLFTRCQLQPGEKVLITGIGGGVAVVAMQLALAAGAEVYVTSGSEEKIARAVAMGAKGGVSYREPGWDKQLKALAGGFDVIVDSAAGDGFALLPGLCNAAARIGFYGGSLGKVNGLSLQPVFWKQISLMGSTMGSPREFGDMLQFVSKHAIVPVVDAVFDMSEGATAMQRLERGEQFGKVVLRN